MYMKTVISFLLVKDGQIVLQSCQLLNSVFPYVVIPLTQPSRRTNS